MIPNQAIIKIARHLLSRIRYGWIKKLKWVLIAACLRYNTQYNANAQTKNGKERGFYSGHLSTLFLTGFMLRRKA